MAVPRRSVPFARVRPPRFTRQAAPARPRRTLQMTRLRAPRRDPGFGLAALQVAREREPGCVTGGGVTDGPGGVGAGSAAARHRRR